MPKCDVCGREFQSGFGLKIHVGRLHKSKGRPAKAGGRGSTTCPICGRKFSMPMHLGRHMTFSHPAARKTKAPRRVAVGRGPRKPKAAAGADVASLSIEQLIGLKRALDARLVEIAGKIRAARIG
jgi:hypothetical protein